MFALPTGALASGFDSVSAQYVAKKKKRSSVQLAVEDSDDELLLDDEASKEAAPVGTGSINAAPACCPTCGK